MKIQLTKFNLNYKINYIKVYNKLQQKEKLAFIEKKRAY